MVGIDQYALKGQKLQAQGNALGNMQARMSPCKGKSVIFIGKFMLLPLQGAFIPRHLPRALPWAWSFWAFSPTLTYSSKLWTFQPVSSIQLEALDFQPVSSIQLEALGFQPVSNI